MFDTKEDFFDGIMPCNCGKKLFFKIDKRFNGAPTAFCDCGKIWTFAYSVPVPILEYGGKTIEQLIEEHKQDMGE